MKVKSILLIGGTGYIGSAIYSRLNRDYIVHVTGRKKSAKFGNDFKYLDYSDPPSIKAVFNSYHFDLVVILAANKTINTGEGIDFTGGLFTDNVVGLNTLMSHITELPIAPIMIFVSSMTVYNPHVASPVKENSKLIPIHSYGLSKLFGEQIFSYHIARSGSRGIILRLPGVFGGQRQGGYIYNLIHKMRAHRSVDIDSTNLGFWEAIYIDDLVEIFVNLIKKYPEKIPLNVFNLAYGEETDFVNTAFIIKKMLKSRSKIKVMSRDYIKFFLSNKKISQYIDFRHYSFRRSLRKYISAIS